VHLLLPLLLNGSEVVLLLGHFTLTQLFNAFLLFLQSLDLVLLLVQLQLEALFLSVLAGSLALDVLHLFVAGLHQTLKLGVLLELLLNDDGVLGELVLVGLVEVGEEAVHLVQHRSLQEVGKCLRSLWNIF
jgi:hypothetical protein